MKLPGAVLLAVLAVSLRAQAPTVRDSAGIRIVDNTARRTSPVVFTLDTMALVTIGGANDTNPELEFNPTNVYLRMLLLTGDRFAVLDRNRVQYFDAKGKLTQVVGRSGAGPAEFGSISGGCQTRGDTLVLQDNSNSRIAILAPDGRVVRTIPMYAVDGSHLIARNGCLGDGTFLATRSTVTAAGSSNAVVRLALSGSVRNAFGTFQSSQFAVPSTFSLLVAAWPGGVYVGSATHYEVSMYDAQGKVQTMIRTSDPITKALPAAPSQTTRPSQVPASAVAVQIDLSGRPFADRNPSYSDILADESGGLWVADWNSNLVLPKSWAGFGPDGKLIGRLKLPATVDGNKVLRVIAFTSKAAVLMTEDADGAIQFSMHAMVRKQ